MKKIKINRNSRLGFYKLVFSKEGSFYIIGREDIEEYIEVPVYGAEAIRLLLKHKKISDVEREIKKKYDNYDILKFAKKLLEIGFVKYVDGQIIPDKHKIVKPSFTFIKKKHISWLFSPFAYFIYLLIAIFASYVLFKNPVYFPSYYDFFFHKRLVVIMAVSFLISWLLVFKHELAHYFAALTVNVKSRFSISNRLYYIVAETDITNLYHVPIKKRFRVYFAGMFSDYIFACIAVILLYLIDLRFIAANDFIYKLLRFIVLTEVLSILWQFMFFMKTDIYFAFENIFKSESLLDDSIEYLKKQIFKIFNIRAKLTSKLFIPKEQINLVRFYTLFLIAGVSISFFRLFTFQIPIIYNLVKSALIEISKSQLFSLNFFDGLVFLIFFSIDYILLFYSLYKNHKKISKNPVILTLHHLINRERDIIFHSQHNSHSIHSYLTSMRESITNFRRDLLKTKLGLIKYGKR